MGAEDPQPGAPALVCFDLDGTLAEMMLRVSDTYDDEVDTAVEGLTSLLEPLLIVFLALIVGTIVVAMFLPLLSLMKGMGAASGM